MAAVEIFAADTVLPNDATVAILYIALVALVARDQNRTRARAFASLTTGLIVVAYLQHPTTAEPWKALFNRSLLIASAWFIVLATPRRIAALHAAIHVELTAQEREALWDTSDVESDDRSWKAPSMTE